MPAAVGIFNRGTADQGRPVTLIGRPSEQSEMTESTDWWAVLASMVSRLP
jgi:hypothetical protein